jgi:NADPH:quinone reductase-like Zn-dependent oxidoreductase
LKAAALNRRDHWITRGLYPGVRPPVVLGSDGAGIVTACGKGVDENWIGREVIIDPGINWGDDPRAQGKEFVILGSPHDGTFASEVAVHSSQLHDKPEKLDWIEAAALPLAGVTAYRAVMTQGAIEPGDTVLITGVGGGVATFTLQFALAVAEAVWVTSSSQEKIDRAITMGARGGANYRDSAWADQLAAAGAEPTLVVDSAGGTGYDSLIRLVAPGGRVVNYGATAGPPEKLDLFKVFWKQLRLQGTTMGSPEDFAAMLEFASKHDVKPLIDEVFPLARGAEAIERMKASPQFGKVVLEID